MRRSNEGYSKEVKIECKTVYITLKKKPSLSEFRKEIMKRLSLQISKTALSRWIKEGEWELERNAISLESQNRIKEEVIKKRVKDGIEKIDTLYAMQSELFDQLMNRCKGKSMEGMAQAIVQIRKQIQSELGVTPAQRISVFNENSKEEDLDKFIRENKHLLEKIPNTQNDKPIN